ncbi:transcription factor AS1-like [Bidens hawaiensis]|uniref:transcription factor AS1-like n=1 Tax=Bidens hawaiensis TaxID=980011 RepID=UPI0040492059
MKDRQRWQPEEDAILRAYAHQYGPREWHLISHRMSKHLDCDPKSCHERWKNYLKPGIKKGSLTPQEQELVVSLQAKYSNKWKKIAAEVPGRTAKRLGKWWEVFKEKQVKQQIQINNNPYPGSPEKPGTYDHILDTFTNKYVQPYSHPPVISLGSGSYDSTPPEPDPSMASSMMGVISNSVPVLPPWKSQSNMSSLTSSKSTTSSPSVSLTLFTSEPVVLNPVHSDHRFFPVQQVGTLVKCCKEVEEAKQNWVQHKKDATWRLSRLEQQWVVEKNRKTREKTEEVEAKIRSLREEETMALGRMESEYREQLNVLHRDAEGKEGKLMQAWSNKQMKLSKLVEQINGGLIQQHMISGTNQHHGLG